MAARLSYAASWQSLETSSNGLFKALHRETRWQGRLIWESMERRPGRPLGIMIRELTRKKTFHGCIALTLATVISVFAQPAAPTYDLVLRGGHVLDDKNHIDGVMDVAIKDGKIASVAAHIPSDAALKTVDVKGLYVTPGLIDIHVHVFAGTGRAPPMRASLAFLPTAPP